jgi:Plasmid pRiA4b ORF-3-like protein
MAATVSARALMARALPSFDHDGDGWQHEITIEKVLKAESGQRYPAVLKGARACPPEDVGGPWGYDDYLVAIRDPDHERHEELLGWRGEFDPDAFDLGKINRVLRGPR